MWQSMRSFRRTISEWPSLPISSSSTAWMTEPMSGLSERAKKELMVPTARVTVVLEGSNVARVPVIPQAQRSNT